jgi:hypothetical protein
MIPLVRLLIDRKFKSDQKGVPRMADRYDVTKNARLEGNSGSQRRAFLKRSLAVVIAAAVILPSVAGGASQRSDHGTESRTIGVSGPLKSKRVLKSSHTKTNNVEDFDIVLELIGANDVRTVSTAFGKRVEIGGEYHITCATHTQYFRLFDTRAVASSSGFVSIQVKKGEAVGDYRIDEMTATSITDGKMEKVGPVQTRVSLTSPFEGLSDQETIDNVLEQRFGRGPVAMQGAMIVKTAFTPGASPASSMTTRAATAQLCEIGCGLACLDSAGTMVGYILCVASCISACKEIVPNQT